LYEDSLHSLLRYSFAYVFLIMSKEGGQ